MSRASGLDEEKLRVLPAYRTDPRFDARERAALAYADAMVATPVEVTEELFTELRTHFDERQLIELTAAIAWENYRARFNHALGIEAQGFSEGAFCPLPERAPG